MLANDNPRKTVGNSRLVREDNGTIIFFFWLEDVCLTRAQNIVNCRSASNRKNIIITFLILSKRLWLIKTILDLQINSLEKKNERNISLSSLQNQSIF